MRTRMLSEDGDRWGCRLARRLGYLSVCQADRPLDTPNDMPIDETLDLAIGCVVGVRLISRSRSHNNVRGTRSQSINI
jgi:hypothetical protein